MSKHLRQREDRKKPAMTLKDKRIKKLEKRLIREMQAVK